MAVLRTNSMVKGFSGSIGKLVLKQVRGKTILSRAPKFTGKQSEKQRENRLKFKAASVYAKHILTDPQKKAYYLQKAKKLKLPNAYTAVIKDYMSKSEIRDINTSKFKGKAGDTIKIKVFKKHFAVHKVRIIVCDEQGSLLTSAMAVRRGMDEFVFTAAETLTLKPAFTVKAIIEDHSWNKAQKQITLSNP
ncbi:hypothetical protein [Chryseosolibacter indicus]|uniref:Uncharacterized protein n=1 Tax=Chryseosolibacter indicus TaxID=2782351 RepID=A0ABS5VM77_9BACT|nr:hypothetical protein [Chryseosolibacter indicus]MBT1702113.1 hypothetical protein [Chryseosolibacter indicus]